jgi:hypothetical protein
MCTVAFIPGLPGGGYLLATNRDESPRRGVAEAPARATIAGRQVLAPRDPDQGGTWIGLDEHGACVTVLNGDRPAATAPVEEPPSRGLLVLDLLEDLRFPSVREELERLRHANLLVHRPFKLVVVSPGPTGPGGREATMLRANWNGSYLTFEEEQGPQCTVSSTFETDGVTASRRAAFQRFLEEQGRLLGEVRGPEASPAAVDRLAEALLGFHASHHPEAPEGDAYSVCMHRDEARTVSRTLVVVGRSEAVMRYHAGWPCQTAEEHRSVLPRTS